jgi:hypothetical protein
MTPRQIVRAYVYIGVLIFLGNLAWDVLIVRHTRAQFLLMVGLPAIVGMIGAFRLGRVANFCLMMAVFQLILFVGSFLDTGRLYPLFLLPGAGILPGIGMYSGISIGGLLFPLLFGLVAVSGVRRRIAE